MTTLPSTIAEERVDLQGRVDVLGTIHSMLSGYSGGITIIREMAQNADDVPGDDERWLEFHFQPDRLIIKNSTLFRDIDFENISTIARGGKRLEQRRTIGMFGVGFLSVYQLTDTPIIRSNGIEQRMQPQEHGFPISRKASPVTSHTEFELPYRRERTSVGDWLDMPEVTDEWIGQILADLPREAYRLLFFLRRLRRVTVYQEGNLVIEVCRTIQRGNDGIERLILQTRRGDNVAARQTWLRFSADVSGEMPKRKDGVPAKDPLVQVVFPDADVPEAQVREHLEGRLYNYLPTDIPTGLPFQLNGDFYPSTDRKGIDNDHLNHHEWNTRVLHALGECVAGALPALLACFTAQPLLLYQRIDTRNARPLVAPIVERLYAAARPLRIFYAAGGWALASEVRWVHPQLRAAAEGASALLLSAAIQAAAAPLVERLGVPEFTFAELLQQIQIDLANSHTLAEGPAYLRTPAQLNTLYATLDTDIARGHDALVSATRIFLDHTGRLSSAKECVRSPDQTLRDNLAESGLHFWTGDPERYRSAAHLVAPFTLSHLWDALRKQLAQDMPLADAPAWLNTTTKLYRLYRTILRTRDQPNKSEVANLPLCLNRRQRLCSPTKLRRPEGDPALYDIFADDPDTALIAKEIYDQRDFRSLYEDLGVPPFTLDDLFDRLGKIAREEVPLEQAHPCLNSREKLLRLYRYLRDKRPSLARDQIENLRHRLPIWLCRNGRLRYAKELNLPPKNADLPQGVTVNNVLDLQTGDLLHTFVEEVIELRPLSPQQFVLHSLLPQYGTLDRTVQMGALRYLRDHLAIFRPDEPVMRALRQAALIYGEDQQLHRAEELCLPRADGHALFAPHLREIHAGWYAAPSGDLTKWIWYDFFRALGIGSYPPPAVVLKTIRNITAQPPQGQARDTIEKIFRFLESQWERYYQDTNLAGSLRSLKWLPADGDEGDWYRPGELYMRQDKPLVSYAAAVLGFTEARRPKVSIADALGFPTKVPVHVLVQQLLALSQRGEPATPYLYQVLSRDLEQDEQLKPLRGRKVIYSGDRYWSAEQVFVSDQRPQFGRYRGYLTQNDARELLIKLRAKEQPSHKDFVELLREISAQHRADVPEEDVRLVLNAYERLADADDRVIETLATLPCVLIPVKAEEGRLAGWTLCLPDHAILIPPDRYHKRIPDLPVASYTPPGERLLERIGVRRLQAVLRVEFGLTPEHTRPKDLTPIFSKLTYAIRRLLHHGRRDLSQDEPAVLAVLTRLKCYRQRAIQVVYKAQLGSQTYSSALTNEASHYDPDQHLLYLREGLTPREEQRELARVLRQIPALGSHSLALLTELLAEPEDARTILDDNEITPLPPDLDDFELAPVEQTAAPMTLGAADEPLLDPEPLQNAPPEPTPADARRSPAPTGVEPTSALAPDAAAPQQRFSPPPALGNGASKSAPQPAPAHGASSQAARATPQPGATNGQHPHADAQRPGPTATPAAKPHPSAPPFQGPSTLRSPQLATDRDGLTDRVRRWDEVRGLAAESAPLATPPAPRPWRVPAQPTEKNQARVVLSFPEVMYGFLRITAALRSLFLDRPSSVECETEFGDPFTLWFDWSRETPIVYNQQHLRDFFLDQGIPAGGIVYLERLHGQRFRLFYNQAPHTVREVRIAFNEQGEVRYELLDAVEVVCETDEAIYRAEKRFEDQAALWLEAAGKKSVEETLCDLLMAAPDGWVHQDDLQAMVGAERMVSASTVEQVLRQKPAFASDGQGHWRLDAAALLNDTRNQPVQRWRKATNALLASDDGLLDAARETIHPLLAQLQGRMLRLEAAASQVDPAHEEAALLEQLGREPRNQIASAGLKGWLQQRAAAPAPELASDERLRALLRAAPQPVWDAALRTLLREQLAELQRGRRYEQALALAQSWADFDQAHGLDLPVLAAEAEAAQLIRQEVPTVEQVLRALAIAPTLLEARTKLHLATQAALRQHPPDHWLSCGPNEQAVTAFIASVKQLADARAYLGRAHQPVFDRTVLEEARKLWPHLDDHGKLRLLLWLRPLIPTALQLNESELRLLLRVARAHQGTLNGLLIGQAAWLLCPEGRPVQPEIAAHLAMCCCTLELWEKANNTSWKAKLDRTHSEELRRGWERNTRSQIDRERRRLHELQQPDHSPLGETLAEDRAALCRDWERELRKLIGSAG